MMVVAAKSKAAVLTGEPGGVKVKAVLDSGSFVSLVQCGVLSQAQGIKQVKGVKSLRLGTASGDSLPIVDCIVAPVRIGELELMHEFSVVQNLVAPVILGIDFLHDNTLVLDFTETPVRVCREPVQQSKTIVSIAKELPKYQSTCKEQAKVCAIAGREQANTDVIDECAVPMYQKPTSIDLPECPGVTDSAHHYIPMSGNPVRVPPWRIPAHYQEEVEQQIDTMKQRIIEEIQFRRMPFGLTGVPSTFQRLIGKVLRGLPFVTIYVDEILVHSATEQQHC